MTIDDFAKHINSNTGNGPTGYDGWGRVDCSGRADWNGYGYGDGDSSDAGDGTGYGRGDGSGFGSSFGSGGTRV